VEAQPAKPSEDRIDAGTIMALVAMSLAVLVIANDFAAINVAIPQIEKDFDTSVSTAQWVVNAYALTFGVLIVTGGRLADLFGRRTAFFVGAGIFGTMSLLGGAAQSEAWLIAARVLMGIGGALMWPAILGMTYAALPASRAGLAGGLILGVAGLGNAMGPLIGGVFTDLLSWRWIFFFNVPVSIFAITITYLKVHQGREEVEDARIDYPGIATISLGLVALLLAFDQALDWGWGDPIIIGLLAFSAVMIVAFAVVERGAGAHALIPRDVIRSRDFAACCASVMLISGTFFALLLYVPQYLLTVRGWSPIGAGAGMLPMMGLFALTSFVAGPLYKRTGAKPLVLVGGACIVIGAVAVSLIEVDSTYGALAAGLAIAGVGCGLFFPTTTTAGVTSVDSSRTSLAGGILYMFQIAGGSIGLGLTTTILVSAGRGTSGAGAALVDGMHTAFRVDALIALVGLALAAAYVGGKVTVPHFRYLILAGHSPRGHGP
jgi:EmrB/QacA subfamily drug resistance transporter